MPLNDKDTARFGETEPLRSEAQGFAPNQMIRCEVCLRANPPTRTSCLYCAAQLPITEATFALQRPTLRHLENWEQGFNVILMPEKSSSLPEGVIREAANLLRMAETDLNKIVEAGLPLPVARAATEPEASFVSRKLSEMSLKTTVIADIELGLNDSVVRRARALEFTGDSLVVYPTGGGETSFIAWPEIVLMVAGRLFTREIEVEERKGRRAENEIVEARELSADGAVLDIYTPQSESGWRISSGNFDFSCLGSSKGLLTAQNFSALVELLRLRTSEAVYDDSYNRIRRQLAQAWPLVQQTEARGWHRKRPGRVSTEAITRSDNELQFTRYSRLRHYFQQHSLELSI